LIPDGTHVHGDVSLFIYAMEKHADFGAVCQSIFLRAKRGQISLSASELVLVEALVVPLRSRDTALVDLYLQLFSASWITMVPVNRAILIAAAELRARNAGLRTPDALHAASAAAVPGRRLVTNDRQLERMLGSSAILITTLARNSS